MTTINLLTAECNFNRTQMAIDLYDHFFTVLSDPSVNTSVASQLLPIADVLIRNVVVCFAEATGQDVPKTVQAFSRGDISSIRHAISTHAGNKRRNDEILHINR